jgi:hypothetical protein
LRDGARLTAASAAGTLGWSESKLSRVENAKIGIQADDLGRLLSLYDVSEMERDRLLKLAGHTGQRGRWDGYSESLVSVYESYVTLEAEATAIRNFEVQLVPGLLQTAEYSRAVIEIEHADNPQLVADRVAVRLARQAVLTRQPPPHLYAILDEAALQRPIGGPDVMRRQLYRLLEASERPTVTIQILPFSVGTHRGLAGSFVVLEFADREADPVVYCEGLTGGIIRTTEEDWRTYQSSFASLMAAALTPADSAALIRALARDER